MLKVTLDEVKLCRTFETHIAIGVGVGYFRSHQISAAAIQAIVIRQKIAMKKRSVRRTSAGERRMFSSSS